MPQRRSLDVASRFSFVPRTAAERRRTPSLVDVAIDPAQREAIDLPSGNALLVLGEAGHGKTTVLLHRVARLWRAANGSGRSMRAAVIVPTDGLVRLIQPLLRRLGVDVEVSTIDRFVAKQARQAFRRLPRESELTPPSVMRLKRSPAVRLALAELAGRDPGVIDDDADAPARRPRRLSARVSRGDLQHLFGDRALMERVASEGSLPPSVVDDVLDRTRVQFTETAEREWAHVTDRERLLAVDQRSLDDGTSTGHASTVDVEDYAVLFELERMRAARRDEAPIAPRAFDLVAIDEAQELAPLELALIGRSLTADGTLVVSGDAEQHTGETSTFLGWDAVMHELGVGEHTTMTLEIGYRCPEEVVTLARGVRDGLFPAARNETFENEQSLVRELGRAARALLDHDRTASIALICRHPSTVRRIAALLQSEEVPTRVVFDGRFLPRGPVQVSMTSEVKGLEFDYVVVPDASAGDWRDDAASRRALYVAITRARRQVLFGCSGMPTPLLASPLSIPS